MDMKRLHIKLTVALMTFITAIAADSFLNFIKSKGVTQEAVIKHSEGDENANLIRK